MSRNYRNEYLFSGIYLQDIIQRPVTDENIKATFKTIKEWREYADKTSLEKWITIYIEPILDTLGFGHHQDQKQTNIFVLFPDIDKMESMSLCYVVSPGENINCTLKGKHWAEKIIRNLRKHNFQWGILTDGFYWRIYHTKESTPYETYLEVDLENILKNRNYTVFQLFYFFFRPDNFTRGENKECKFDTYKEKSAKTTEYIEKNLKAAIERTEAGGEGALQTLCLGYLNVLKKDTYSEEERIHIYRGATLYLFRLLFLFYATARNLLEEESIEAFKSVVQDSFQLHTQGGIQNNSYDLWHRLQNLFAKIDLTYDGGLFNPYESNLTRFIEVTKITDPFLSEIIFGLGYYQKSKGNFVSMEYRDLSVRHLGSLYEGLLEHKLFIAEENTVVRKSGKKIQFISESKTGKIRRSDTVIEKGKVYFSEDAKERKLTGSYYTPEDVVEYIVKNTVDTLLQEKKKKLMNEIKPAIDEIKTAINESERGRFKLFIDDKILKFIEEEVLSLSVLDPTMGSGHFLVNATNHIANFIVELLNETTNYTNNVKNELVDISGLDSNPAYWRRRVVESCIYGVDLNPLAVELAKLCLWITTAFKEKPLSFLNHHLKQGNALVGVRISDLEKYLKKSKSEYGLFMQLYISSIEQAAESFKKKLSKLTQTREDIEEKKEVLEELDKELAPYKQLCNLFTHHLLDEIDEEIFLSQVESWNKSGTTNDTNTTNKTSKDFFHWELEFPDVFHGDNPGFNCVIGNPPYVQQQDIVYNPIISKTKKCRNTYAFIIEESVVLIRSRGMYGFIIPMSSICTERMFPLQNLLNSQSWKIKITNFAERPGKIFTGVEQKVSIILGVKKDKGNKFCQILSSGYIQWNTGERKILFSQNSKKICYVNCETFIKSSSIPKLSKDVEINILRKLYNMSHKIIDITINNNPEVRICYHAIGRYWLTAFDFIPIYKRGDKIGVSSDYKILDLENEELKDFIICLLNSSLFYWYWITYSDCFHLTKKFIEGFPVPFKKIQDKLYSNGVNRLCRELMIDYQKNSILKTTNYSTGKITHQEFSPSKSKKIIDKIDSTLGGFYDLSKLEINFICNFHSKFRMNENEL